VGATICGRQPPRTELERQNKNQPRVRSKKQAYTQIDEAKPDYYNKEPFYSII